jgi:hypothetical protein
MRLRNSASRSPTRRAFRPCRADSAKIRVGATPSVSAARRTWRSISTSTSASLLPPSRSPSILLSATKQVASIPAIVPTCSFHNAWSCPVMPSAESMNTIAAASGTRWNDSSGSEASVV